MVTDDQGVDKKNSRKIGLVAAMVAVLVVIVLLVVWVFLPESPVEPTVSTPGVSQEALPEPAPEAEPEPAPQAQEPTAPEEPPEEPLPPLAESDQAIRGDIAKVTNNERLQQLLTPDNVILKSVRAISALEEGALVNKYRPIAPPDSAFEAQPVEKASDDATQQYVLNDQVYQRYNDYVNMLVNLNTSRLVRLYNRYYPLLEQAYTEQGVDKGEFRDVTLAAIDQMLAAPIIEEDILLERPSVMYKFADPKLEALPGAQKLMLRIGPDNARTVKGVLRELRAGLEQ